MFWKKKIDVTVEANQGDDRTAFRIVPDKNQPVIITVKDDSFVAVNISGNGVAFRSEKFPLGTTAKATVSLPGQEKVIPVTIEVVSKQSDLCRCYFRHIHQDAENFLHSHVLKMQKQKIRENNIKQAASNNRAEEG